MLADFKRLWATNFLDDLAVDVQDYRFSNGVIGKMIVYDMEERQRVKIVDYVGSKKVEQSKIDEELKKQNLRIALDSFIDQGLIRKVAGVVREHVCREGLRVRRGQARGQAGQHRHQDRERDASTSPKARR